MKSFDPWSREDGMQQCLDGDCLRQEASVKIQYTQKLSKLLDSLGKGASLQMCVSYFQWSGAFVRDMVTKKGYLGNTEDMFTGFDKDPMEDWYSLPWRKS